MATCVGDEGNACQLVRRVVVEVDVESLEDQRLAPHTLENLCLQLYQPDCRRK